jgi:hypothetical protein
MAHEIHCRLAVSPVLTVDRVGKKLEECHRRQSVEQAALPVFPVARMQVLDDEDAALFQQGEIHQKGAYDVARPVGAIIDDDVEPGADGSDGILGGGCAAVSDNDMNIAIVLQRLAFRIDVAANNKAAFRKIGLIDFQ